MVKLEDLYKSIHTLNYIPNKELSVSITEKRVITEVSYTKQYWLALKQKDNLYDQHEKEVNSSL